ncbi:MAG: peptidase T [Treponema sp.]
MDPVDRFLKYIAVDTQSNEANEQCPSTAGQLELGKIVVEELHSLGITNAVQDEHGYIYASIPANTAKPVPSIGFIAHLDTSPDLDGKCTNPHIVQYTGGDIQLNDRYALTVKEFPFLKKLAGEQLITTDGTTLLGADDKAGITIIMGLVEYLCKNPEVEHGAIKIGFTPDEEIGRGADLFNVAQFGADFAYTIDGGEIGQLEYENFNGASVKIAICGKNVHPGTAKNIMINSLRVGYELDSMLPAEQKPEYTEGYEGFFLLTDMKGTVDHTEMNYIIRDHSAEKFAQKKALMSAVVDFLNKKYGDIITLSIKDSYYNMRSQIEPHIEIIELARKSMEEIGITPIIHPIRGGTDGARLSFMGLPCPNIFAGGFNFHGRFECIPTSSLYKGIELLICIMKNAVKDEKITLVR